MLMYKIENKCIYYCGSNLLFWIVFLKVFNFIHFNCVIHFKLERDPKMYIVYPLMEFATDKSFAHLCSVFTITIIFSVNKKFCNLNKYKTIQKNKYNGGVIFL